MRQEHAFFYIFCLFVLYQNIMMRCSLHSTEMYNDPDKYDGNREPEIRNLTEIEEEQWLNHNWEWIQTKLSEPNSIFQNYVFVKHLRPNTKMTHVNVSSTDHHTVTSIEDIVYFKINEEAITQNPTISTINIRYKLFGGVFKMEEHIQSLPQTNGWKYKKEDITSILKSQFRSEEEIEPYFKNLIIQKEEDTNTTESVLLLYKYKGQPVLQTITETSTSTIPSTIPSTTAGKILFGLVAFILLLILILLMIFAPLVLLLLILLSLVIAVVLIFT